MATTSRAIIPQRPRWRSLWLAVSAGLALVLGGSLLPAQATPEASVSAALPPGYELVETTHNVTLQPNESFRTFNRCPSGKSLYGGGASMSLEPTGAGAPSLISNGPPPNAPEFSTDWVAEYINPGTAATSFGVRVTAVCGSNPGGLLYDPRPFRLPVPPGGYREGSVLCPSGYRILSGGVTSVTNPRPFALLENARHGQGWEALWTNLGTSEADSGYTITPICADPASSSFFSTTTVTTVPTQMETANIPPGGSHIRLLDCPGSPVVGGIGVWSVSPPSATAPQLTVVEDGPIPPSGVGQTRWRFRLLNFGTTELRVQFRADVTCIS